MIAPLRIAACQRRPIFDDDAASADAIARDLDWADAHDVDLVVFPECAWRGHSYAPPVIEGRAMSLQDDALARLLRRIAGFRSACIIGLFERRGDLIFNSAIVVAAGRVVGTYAKVHPNEERVTAGTHFPVFNCREARFGIGICNDANYPDGAAELAGGGAQVLCYPLNNLLNPATADRWRERSVQNLQARARQTRCWVVSADVTGVHHDLMSYGCTMIVAPDGSIMVRAAEHEETTILYDCA